MAQPHTDLATGFESRMCSRCCGSGRYSFNQMHRDMCYGCRGCGLVFTMRGSVARQYFQDSILTAAGDVKAGWIARGNNGKWFPVVSVEPYQLRGASLTNGVMVPYDRPGVEITYGRVGHIEDLTNMIPAQPNIVAVSAFRDAALLYQQTLTQAGTVRKKAA
jgi:hypothetical protein